VNVTGTLQKQNILLCWSFTWGWLPETPPHIYGKSNLPYEDCGGVGNLPFGS